MSPPPTDVTGSDTNGDVSEKLVDALVTAYQDPTISERRLKPFPTSNVKVSDTSATISHRANGKTWMKSRQRAHEKSSTPRSAPNKAATKPPADTAVLAQWKKAKLDALIVIQFDTARQWKKARGNARLGLLVNYPLDHKKAHESAKAVLNIKTLEEWKAIVLVNNTFASGPRGGDVLDIPDEASDDDTMEDNAGDEADGSSDGETEEEVQTPYTKTFRRQYGHVVSEESPEEASRRYRQYRS